jgi:hypothetical protein
MKKSLNKFMKLLSKVLIVLVALAFTLNPAGSARAATTPDLGQAASFGILSSTYTNTVGGTTISGDLGYTTGPAVAPTVNGTTYSPPDSKYSTAGTDQGAALANLNSQPCTHTFPAGAVDLATDTSHGTIGVYEPGVYCTTASSAASIGSGGITLTGGGTYIFRINGALTTVANSVVTLAGGASACDVFWTPTGATTLGANSTFAGTNIDDAGITIGSTVTWTGRALSFGGTVSTDTDTINVPSCGGTTATTASSSNGGSGGSEPAPLINVVKVPNPLALSDGAGSVTYTYTVTNIGDVVMNNVTLTDNKCSPVTFLSGDRNSDSLLDLDEIWTYRCTTTLAATTTNTATVTGTGPSGVTVRDTAIAKVVVGQSIVPPLINVVKVPNVFVVPAGGGPVTYTYTVTNPGTVPLSNVTVTDDKCTGLPGRVVGHPGDLNKNNLLESNESWSFTCQTSVLGTTTNIGTARGQANGLTAIDTSFSTVVAGAPGLPNTGSGSDSTSKASWTIIISSGIGLALYSFSLVRQKQAR